MYCHKCKFWNADAKQCTDQEVYVNSTDGEYCCRYHPNAVEPMEDTMPKHTDMDRVVDELKKENKRLKDCIDYLTQDTLPKHMEEN